MNDKNASPFLPSGKFITGVNYWQSQTATQMWSKWDEDAVERDFRALKAAGASVLRVFPLWPDFQPITRLYLGDGTPTSEFRFGEEALPDTEAGRAGIDEVMMQRFERMADLARTYRLSLIVALLTGQMTYRLYLPPGLAGLNPLSDPVALLWERRFVQYFVRHMKPHPAIVAWEFGNECDIWKASNREQVWCWLAYIADSIRLCDNTRPVVSGTVSRHLDDSPFSKELWTVQTQAEHCDILTAHSYMQWSFVGSDPCDTIKQVLAPTVEVRLATDISGKPAFMEEIGLAWRPMMASYDRLGAYMRNNLWNLWADDGRGLLWWCGFDQSHLTISPYNWEVPGPEHGIMTRERKLWSSGREMASFRKQLDSLPFDTLPRVQDKAVCLIGDSRQHQNAVATGAYILAKQAGFNLEFQHARQPLKKSDFYLLPSARGKGALSVERWEELKRAVKAGATLYLSTDDVYLPGVADVFGAEVVTSQSRQEPVTFDFDLGREPFHLTLPVTTSYRMQSLGADERGKETGGSPVFFEASYGKGRVYLLSFPLEKLMAETPSAFLEPASADAWKLYAHMARPLLVRNLITKTNPFLSITEHPVSSTERIIVAVNNSPEKVDSPLTLKKGWKLKRVFPAQAITPTSDRIVDLCLKGNSGAVLVLERLK